MKTKILFSLMAAFLLSTTLIMAQPGEGQQKGKEQEKGKCPGKEKCEMKHEGKHGIPNLTDEQSKKVEALHLSLKKEMLPLENQMGELKAKQQTLTTAEKADMKAINANIDAITALQNQMMKKRAENRQQIRSILTDEQRIEFDSRHHDSKGPRSEMGPKGDGPKDMKQGKRAHMGEKHGKPGNDQDSEKPETPKE
jgi:Spy/CpxP family protein refolding chaperone